MDEEEALSTLRGQDPLAAEEAEAALWRLWSRSGDQDVDGLFAEAVEALEEQELERAEGLLDRIIQQAPGFAEGWNKRATVRYLAENYAGAIADCEAALERNPHHFGALSGQGLCHAALGQHRQAAALFMRTLAVHPHLVSARQNLAAAMQAAIRGSER
jgi:tetratricopeptide (TPR) repeat protein